MECTDMERRILDMWPKYEDGEYVMYEDEFDFDGEVKTAYGFNFGVGGRASICSDKGSHVRLPNGESGIVQVQYADEDTFECRSSDLTHKQPDNWELLELDAKKGSCEYLGCLQSSCDGCYLSGKSACDKYVRSDLVRRAKALAEKEAAR